MVNRIIDEIQICLEQENYIAALTMALTLPDICGKAAEPSLGNGARYKKWYEQHIANNDKPKSVYDADMPYLSKEVMWQLRNSMLHQGNPNVDAKSINEEQCKIDQFILFVDDPYDSGLSVVSYGNGLKGITNKKLEVNLVLTCNRICKAAKEYYENNIERFDFFNYTFENRKKSREEYERVLNLLQGKHKE